MAQPPGELELMLEEMTLEKTEPEEGSLLCRTLVEGWQGTLVGTAPPEIVEVG